MSGCLVLASYNASLRTHFVRNCPPTLQSWPCDVSEIKVRRVLLPLLLIPRNTLFLLILTNHNTNIKNRGGIYFIYLFIYLMKHLILGGIIRLIIRTQQSGYWLNAYCKNNKNQHRHIKYVFYQRWLVNQREDMPAQSQSGQGKTTGNHCKFKLNA